MTPLDQGPIVAAWQGDKNVGLEAAADTVRQSFDGG